MRVRVQALDTGKPGARAAGSIDAIAILLRGRHSNPLLLHRRRNPMSQDRIIALLRQVNAGTAITAEDESMLQREGLIDVIETFPVTIELTLRGKRMLAAGSSPYSEAVQRRADVIAAENGETVGERNVIRESVLPLCAEIERLTAAHKAARERADGAEWRLRQIADVAHLDPNAGAK